MRHWAYRAIRELPDAAYDEWEAEVLTRALNTNTGFSSPLDYKEVHSTARSIAKWVWRNHGSAEFQAIFSAKQAARGSKGGKASNSSKGGKARSEQYSNLRTEALKLHVLGINNTQIAKQLNVSRMTVNRWLKSATRV